MGRWGGQNYFLCCFDSDNFRITYTLAITQFFLIIFLANQFHSPGAQQIPMQTIRRSDNNNMTFCVLFFFKIYR